MCWKQPGWHLETTEDSSERFDVHHKCTLTPQEIKKGPQHRDIYPSQFVGVNVLPGLTIIQQHHGNPVMHTQHKVGDSDETEVPQIAQKKLKKWLLPTGHVVIIQVGIRLSCPRTGALVWGGTRISS